MAAIRAIYALREPHYDNPGRDVHNLIRYELPALIATGVVPALVGALKTRDGELEILQALREILERRNALCTLDVLCAVVDCARPSRTEHAPHIAAILAVSCAEHLVNAFDVILALLHDDAAAADATKALVNLVTYANEYVRKVSLSGALPKLIKLAARGDTNAEHILVMIMGDDNMFLAFDEGSLDVVAQLLVSNTPESAAKTLVRVCLGKPTQVRAFLRREGILPRITELAESEGACAENAARAIVNIAFTAPEIARDLTHTLSKVARPEWVERDFHAMLRVARRAGL
jgi:hypothetical protein